MNENLEHDVDGMIRNRFQHCVKSGQVLLNKIKEEGHIFRKLLSDPTHVDVTYDWILYSMSHKYHWNHSSKLAPQHANRLLMNS